MSGGKPAALVIGAGVCGLTSAICLSEADLDVTILASRLPPQTTSAAAGAIWGPHLVEDSERVHRWGRDTLQTLTGLAGQPGTGIAMMTGIEAWRQPAEPPHWSGLLPAFRRCDRAELPAGFVTGWQYRTPVLSMPVYLGYLLDRFAATGGRLRAGTAGSLAEAAQAAPGADVIVNCAGTGARHLVPDPAVQPVRGQVVIVANPGITGFFVGPASDTADLVYLFPHGDTVLLGGTEQRGDWNTDPDPGISRRILAGCAAVEPRLAGAEILGERVGLRPVRPLVRLAAERLRTGQILLHNYGHGGAGVTLSWGCARDITEQALTCLRERTP